MAIHITRAGALLLVVFLLPLPTLGRAVAQQSEPPSITVRLDLSQPPLRWAEAAAANEERIVNANKAFPLQYLVRRSDAKGETLRQLVETNEGTLARLLKHNHAPLTPDENTDERNRLTDILTSPEAFYRRVQRDEGSKAYASELLRSMAKAMLWSYTAGQPQLPGAQSPAIVLDFKPDPAFKPPSLVTEALTGVAGRVWIDPSTRCVLRIEGRILHPINFGWGGVLARIREGGTVELEQRHVTPNRWLYTHLGEHLSIREVLIHTVDENVTMDTFDVRPLPAPIDFKQAIRDLLAMPLPAH